VDKKTEAREFFKSLITAFQSLVFTVNIHCVYLNVSCRLCYVHPSVCILVTKALLVPIEHGGHCASLTRIPENVQDPTTNRC
jgi:hypothetical protein